MRIVDRILNTTISRRELLGAALLATPVTLLACATEGDDMEPTPLAPGASSFDSNGLRIYYEIAGTGRPLVVLHGWANSYRGFFVQNGMLDLLSPVRTIIGVDQRGHGKSDKPHDPASYESGPMAGDIVALLDHLGVGKADVFGYSMGGLVTARLLTHHSDRVSAAVIGGVGGNLFDPDRSNEPAFQPMIDALLLDDPEDIEIDALRAIRKYYEDIGNDRLALAAWMQAEHFAGPPDMLTGLDIPVLVCNAEADAEGPIVAASIPGAQLEMIPGTNHVTVVADQRFKDRVARFFREIDQA